MTNLMIKHAVVSAFVLSLMACGKDAQVAQAKTAPVVSSEPSKPQADKMVSPSNGESVAPDSVKGVMNQIYGERAYQADGQCWRYETKDHVVYCMSPSQMVYRDGANGKQAYFFAKGSAIENNSDNIPSGLIGFFAMQQMGSKWSYIATQKALECGFQGECNASYMDKSEPELVLLGKSGYYGWVFSDSGNFQGTLVGINHVVAPKNGEFVSLADFIEIGESNQNVTYTFTVEPNERDEVFPLKVYKNVNSGNKKRVVKTYDVPFNKETWLYDLPKSIKN